MKGQSIMLRLFIRKSMDDELNEQEITVLAILNGLYSKKQDVLLTSVSIIGYVASGRFLSTSKQADRTILQNIRTAIQSLADRGIITIIDQNGDNYVISNEGLEVDTENERFVVVELWEIQKIFSVANKPFNVFSFFCCLVGTINNATKEWHMSQDDMVELMSCSKRTINNYLEQLEKMELIYVHRHKKHRADGTYHKLNNSYGRYADKDSIIRAAQAYSNTVECEDITANIDRRAIKLRYNAFCNGAKKYQKCPAAVMELYKECLLYNKSLKSNPVEGVYDGEWKQGEALDLSVFPAEITFKKEQRKLSADDEWGEPDSILHDFTVEEIFDFPTVSELQIPSKAI